MAENLTLQQKMAVENRGGKLLVSAAAGSGKTKVLVDRLLLHLTENNGNVNIDDFLIITYTKAAAAELRGKIAAKINERLAEQPGNKFLQRQLQRLYLTKISTVHAFCADLLREYAYRLDIPGDFRVAEERETQLLQLQIIDKMMEEAYESADEDFITFIDSQELGRDDRSIPGIILQVYNSARCHIDPDAWLQKCVNDSSVEALSDASETVWGQYLIKDLHQYLQMQIDAFEKCVILAEQNGTMEKPAALMRDTVYQLKTLYSLKHWDDIVEHKSIDYGRMVFSKNCTNQELAERIKAVRTSCKKTLEKKLLPFADSSQQVLKDLAQCSSAIHGLVSLVKKFSDSYDRAKKARRILDFGDLEHKTLDLLVGKNRREITALAREIGDRFFEIMVDEYQDSNAVQDAIFSALTDKRQNCFMVGDVKQSIYQFRLADPEIFLDKYNTYQSVEDAKPGQGRKIMLSSNFRSAGNVISAVNAVFEYCMSPEVGGLSYGEDELLREGIPHCSVDEPEVELAVVSVQEDTYEEEASYAAQRITELLDGTHMVRQGEYLRPITADDIVILLRSPGSVGGHFRHALENRGIRVNFGGGMDLLQTEEVGFVRSMLQIIRNPLQDIPLVAALTSRILCFTADELAVIRAQNKGRTLYDCLKGSDSNKATDFLELLRGLRQDSRICTVSELIDRVFASTRLDSIFSSFEDGAVKRGNLQAFCQLAVDFDQTGQKDLGYFLDYLDSLEEKGLITGTEHNVSGAVTIMSIHKSKGLEFPVVFLCGLSRDFNREDARAQVLCNRELGIGMNCVDLDNRVRYPSVAKKAIATKILSDSLSEEMRVLYVAMTRAKDRLIMTYAVPNPEKDIQNIVNRIDLCDRRMLTSGANCPGTWILMTALSRTESGALFSLGGRPDNVSVQDRPWSVKIEEAFVGECSEAQAEEEHEAVIIETQRMKQGLAFVYPHLAATSFASKQTATQLKGRQKDQEVAENTQPPKTYARTWRKPSFAAKQEASGIDYGNAVHAIMQHIKFDRCGDLPGVEQQIARLVEEKHITQQMAELVDPTVIYSFFTTDLGKKIRQSTNVLREFKFSILDDAVKYDGAISDDRILLQGVIDCALIEPEGITVIDFKTDRVTAENIQQTAEEYRMQVTAYADALNRIYKKKVVSAQLYFVRVGQFVSVL